MINIEMKKKPIVILIICLLASLAIVIVLYAISDNMIHRHNSFIRIFPPHPISEAEEVLDLEYNSYYMAGVTHNHLYLGNSTGLFHMVITNTMLTDTQHIKLSVKDRNQKFKSIHVRVDSPYFYIMDGILPGLFRGNINQWVADRFMPDSVYFSLGIPIGPSSFALRSSSRTTREDVLVKETNGSVQFFPGILEKQIDGVFCTDGMLNYNKQMSLLIYVYYYRNQYVVMDTSLSVIYRGNTIDTVRTAQIKVDSIISKENQTYTMSAPPLMVNKKSCSYGDWLFINSDLLAKNETEIAFNQASVIDVYSLKENKYLFSFYIHHYQGNKKLLEFRIHNNKLYGLFDRYLVKYDLNNIYFQKFKSP